MTRTHLLTVAERLFAADGYDAVSVRAICAGAGVNPAAVHYHFGSKDQLTVALLEDRLAPIWDAALDAVDPATASVRTLVDAIIDPLVEMAADPTRHLHLRLVARFAPTHPEAPWTRPWFRIENWSDVLTQMVDSLSAADARRRWMLAFEMLLLRFGGDTSPSSASVAALTDFLVAGLAAPPSPGPTIPRPT